jgi:hypothetical protein
VTSGPLLLGPLLRYVDATSAAVWVETRDRAQVTVRLGDSTWSAGTFAVHGHHYALVELSGLEPGTTTPYSVQVDGEQVWPEPDSPYPPPVIATQGREGRIRMVFGSCRVSVSQDAAGTHEHGVDALLAYALRMARGDHARPDLVLFLGDQVYADETSQEMQDFIAARRDITEPPGTELRDFEEYAYLYELAWTDGPIRWLLSTLPTAMIFDDHDIRDDWNTSITWQQQMRAHTWWNDRIVAGLASYWVYQHLGNLSPHARAEDEVWQQVTGHQGPDEPDLTEFLDKVAYRADRQPETYRWSYVRDVYGVRLVVIDSRAARILTPDRRSMLDDETKAWLEEQMCGGFRHLLIGTSLPFLLPVALHHLVAWDEALAEGAWGPRLARFGEQLRQKADLEHWAAFEDGFHDMARTALSVASGRLGEPPQTVTFLSGDVHHSYLAEVARPFGTRIVQAVCSPIRNRLPAGMRGPTRAMTWRALSALAARLSRSAKVRRPEISWDTTHGPWYANTLATVEDRADGLLLCWETGVVPDSDGSGAPDYAEPRLEEVASVLLRPRP